jgi:hypothetical protein
MRDANGYRAKNVYDVNVRAAATRTLWTLGDTRVRNEVVETVMTAMEGDDWIWKRKASEIIQHIMGDGWRIFKHGRRWVSLDVTQLALMGRSSGVSI